jgi:hypothetical protein
MLSPLLGPLELKCNNTAYRPVMDAIGLLQRYLEQPLKEGAFFDLAESVPLAGVVPEQWRVAVVDDRVERIPYELCVLVALRDALRRREIWVVGANRWRNPEDDLPADFEDNRDVHYAALGQPQDAGEFIAALQGKAVPRWTASSRPSRRAPRAEWRSSRSTASRGLGSPARQAGGAGEPGGHQGRDRAALGHYRPAGHLEVRRVRHGLHRRPRW